MREIDIGVVWESGKRKTIQYMLSPIFQALVIPLQFLADSITKWKSGIFSVSVIGGSQLNWNNILSQTYELAEECLQTNYYGVKMTIETSIALSLLSESPRVVNVSSFMGRLKVVFNELYKIWDCGKPSFAPNKRKNH